MPRFSMVLIGTSPNSRTAELDLVSCHVADETLEFSKKMLQSVDRNTKRVDDCPDFINTIWLFVT